MPNPVGRFEIATNDLKTTNKFYSELFEWPTVAAVEKKYSVVDPGEGMHGLIFKADAGVPPFITVYIEVDDVERYLTRAESLGGTVYVPATPSPVPGERCFAVFGDPEGNIMGLREKA